MISPKRYRALLVLGILLRLGFVLAAGNRAAPPWSAGGDVAAYVTLAGNLLHGRGYSYSGEPTAFRPPLYPILVAGSMALARDLWPIALRLAQFLLGLGAIFLGALIAKKTWGMEAGRGAALLLLWCPTLIYVTSTVSPGIVAAFLVAGIFYYLVRNLKNDWRPAIAGVWIGLSTLVQQVSPVLGIPFVVLYLRRRSFRSLGIILLASAIVVSPWALRNYRVFGRPTLSTYGGYNLLVGLLEPQGRGNPAGVARLQAAVGWDNPGYERNDRGRTYPPETAMNRAAMETWLRLVRADPVRPFALIPAKLGWFWLSTDILFYPGGYSWKVELVRAAMVLVWWAYLLLAALALARVWREGQKGLFWLFVGWFVLVTAVFLPFGMITRSGIPFIDVPVAILAGSGLVQTRLGRRLISQTTP